MEDEVRVAINADADLVTARAQGRAMAERLGFPRPDPTLIATAISDPLPLLAANRTRSSRSKSHRSQRERRLV